MLQLKQWLAEAANDTKIGDWTFVNSNHAFDRLQQRTNFQFADHKQIFINISKKLNGLRIGEYGFASKQFNKIFICDVNPLKKTVRVITVLDGNMKLKQGTGKVITEEREIFEID